MKRIFTLSALFCAQAYCDTIISPEIAYKNFTQSNEAINLPNAQKQNPTLKGNGIEIGILDSGFNTNHPSLSGKELGLINNTNWNDGKNTHGSHVAGIILGKDLQKNTPQGIAPNAKYHGVGILNPNQAFQAATNNLFDYFKDKNVKIINNSWGGNAYPIINKKFNASSYENFAGNKDSIDAHNYFRYITQVDELTNQLYRLSKEKKILNIFASGNEGIISPSVNSVLPSYDESIRSWLVVGAIDAQAFETDKNTGEIKAIKSTCQSIGDSKLCQGIAPFSNAFKGAQNYALMAPGVNISSANANFTNQNDSFIQKNGTSMAAPMVSGVAALVQEKYPFLDGKQIADILLSTANDSFQAPKFVILENNKQSTTKYTIIYIDNPVPSDINAIKNDLTQKGVDADNVLNNLLVAKGADTKSAIISLSKHEVFGQGILDAKKALQGLAKLDANRLNTEDIKDFEGQKYAFYTLNQDSKGDFEFQNDITQKTWDEKAHRNDANELPTAMKNITKIGLIKQGSGALTLSGSNSYEGPTLIYDGILEFKGNNQKINLTNSDAYAKNTGILLLHNAILNKSATADKGAIHIKDKAQIKENTLIKNDGSLTLSKDSKNPATLTTKQVTLSDGGILEGAGVIDGNVINLSGIVFAGFIKGDLKVGAENILNITKTYEHKDKARLQILFDNQGNDKNSQIKAQTFKINGGKLEFRPTYNGQDTRLKDGDIITLALQENFKNAIKDFKEVEIVESNTLEFTFDEKLGNITFHSDLKEDAFLPNKDSNHSLSGVLQGISKQDLPKAYDEFLGKIDTELSKEQFDEVIKSIDDKSYLINVRDLISTQGKTELNALTFLTSTLPLFTEQKTYFASLDSKLNDDLIFEALNASDLGRSFALNTSYTRQNATDYHANTYAFDLQAKKKIAEDFLLAGYFGYGKTDTTHKYASGKMNQFLLGVQTSYNIRDDLYLYNGASLSLARNENQKNIAYSNATSYADYNTYLMALQVGLGKDFWLKSINIKPMIMAHYSLAYQEDFKESSALFSRKVDSSTYDSYGASLGVNAQYTRNFDEVKAYFNGFGFYSYRRYGSFKNNASFNDFDNTTFRQDLKDEDTHSFYFGIITELLYKDFFTKIGLSSDISNEQYSINTLLTFGVNF